jgi:hypothetical protein
MPHALDSRTRAMYVLMALIGLWGSYLALVGLGALQAALLTIPTRGAAWLRTTVAAAESAAIESAWLSAAVRMDTPAVRAQFGLEGGWPRTLPAGAQEGGPLDEAERATLGRLHTVAMLKDEAGARVNRWGGPAFSVAWGSLWFGNEHKWVGEGYFECPPPTPCAISFTSYRVHAMRRPDRADLVLYHRAPGYYDAEQFPPGYQGLSAEVMDSVWREYWRRKKVGGTRGGAAVGSVQDGEAGGDRRNWEERLGERYAVSEGGGEASRGRGSELGPDERPSTGEDPSPLPLSASAAGRGPQRHALMGAENFPVMFLPRLTSPFDAEVSYRQASLFRDGGYEHLALGYADAWPSGAQTWNDLFTQPPVEPRARRSQVRQRQATVTWAATHCNSRSGRERLLYEMMRSRLKVDVWGTTCLANQNRSDPVNVEAQPWPQQSSRWRAYKFHIVFENSVCSDYVTEKAFLAWSRGQVPIVMSAPNFGDYAPARDSYIDAMAFGSVEELVAEVLRLDEDDEAYARLLAWRDRPFSTYGVHLRRTIEGVLPTAAWTGPGHAHVGTWWACDMCRALAREQEGGGRTHPPAPVPAFRCWKGVRVVQNGTRKRIVPPIPRTDFAGGIGVSRAAFGEAEPEEVPSHAAEAGDSSAPLPEPSMPSVPAHDTPNGEEEEAKRELVRAKLRLLTEGYEQHTQAKKSARPALGHGGWPVTAKAPPSSPG